MKTGTDMGYRRRHAKAAIEKVRAEAIAAVERAAADALEQLGAADAARDDTADTVSLLKADNAIVWDFKLPGNWPETRRLSLEFAGGWRLEAELVRPIPSGVPRRAFLLIFPGPDET